MILDRRFPEPELMDDSEQAEAYAAADFSEPHQAFVSHFQRRFPDFDGRELVDLGCGSCDVTCRFARAYPHATITAVDGAPAMLERGRRLIAAQQLESRISLKTLRMPDGSLSEPCFDAVICNSLLHHLADPSVLWDTVRHCVWPGGPIFVMDLRRPASTEEAVALVETYAGDEAELLRRDFYHSLLAAYRPEEIEDQLRAADLAQLAVEALGDRHLLIWGRAAPR